MFLLLYSENSLFVVYSKIIMLSISPIICPLSNAYRANFELLLLLLKRSSTFVKPGGELFSSLTAQ
jgi:hypothetical protein